MEDIVFFPVNGRASFQLLRKAKAPPRVELLDLDTGTSLTNAIERVCGAVYMILVARGLKAFPEEVEWFATDSYGERCRVLFHSAVIRGGAMEFTGPTWKPAPKRKDP